MALMPQHRQTMIHIQGGSNIEIATILTKLAAQFNEARDLIDGPIRDDDGNQVGLIKTLYIGGS